MGINLPKILNLAILAIFTKHVKVCADNFIPKLFLIVCKTPYRIMTAFINSTELFCFKTKILGGDSCTV